MVKAVNIAAPGLLVVLLAACQASPARQAAASADRLVREPLIAYVANQRSGTVTAFNTRTRTVFTPIKVGTNPMAIAITPDGKTAYVSNDQIPGTVTPIDLVTKKSGRPVRVGPYPQAIAVSPNGKTAYVLNEDSVTPIDLATGVPGKTVNPAPGFIPSAIAFTPDGQTAYVTTIFATDSTVESDMPGFMTPIRIATGTLGKPIQPGNNPQAIAITPDGTIAYVTNWQGQGTVTPVKIATGIRERPIDVGSHPDAIALTRG
jgi:YVTN family beta-propeller protein